MIELTKDEAGLLYCITKPYYTRLLKEHYQELEEHGKTTLYNNQELEMLEIIKLQNKLYEGLENEDNIKRITKKTNKNRSRFN